MLHARDLAEAIMNPGQHDKHDIFCPPFILTTGPGIVADITTRATTEGVWAHTTLVRWFRLQLGQL